jgi:hypothetical protein
MKYCPISANFGPKSKIVEILIFYPTQVGMVKKTHVPVLSFKEMLGRRGWIGDLQSRVAQLID